MASRAALKRFAKLKQKKHREADRLFLAEGDRLVREAPLKPVFLSGGPEEVARLSTLMTPAGPVAVFPFLDVSGAELLRRSRRIVFLHGVQDPGNVGVIVRSAHAFDAGVALSKECADLYNPKTVRATMGSIFHVPIARELESEEFLEEARDAGLFSVAAVPGDGESPDSLPGEPVVILVGSEGGGLPERIVSACDAVVTIPGRAKSLNVAMAASILLYQSYSRVLP